MAASRKSRYALPFQVAAVCYRRTAGDVEFLLVRTNGGNKWTFPKGSPSPLLSHSKAAEREALEEAGVGGSIDPRHFFLYLHSKGVFWKPPGVTEYVVKAFLLQVEQSGQQCEDRRNPTWFGSAEVKPILAKGREVKYARELHAVVDKALEHIALRHGPLKSPSGSHPGTSANI